MHEEQRQEFEESVKFVQSLMRPSMGSHEKNLITLKARTRIRQCLASGLTLTDGIELARHALRRLREDYPDENEFRRAVGWLTYFIYPLCSDRLVQGQPKEKSSAAAMARACLPLLAIADDEHKRETPFSLAVRTLDTTSIM